MDELKAQDQWRVDVPELSALALRFGDSDFSISSGSAQALGRKLAVRGISLRASACYVLATYRRSTRTR
jgi:hypothetical protein